MESHNLVLANKMVFVLKSPGWGFSLWVSTAGTLRRPGGHDCVSVSMVAVPLSYLACPKRLSILTYRLPQ